MKARKLTLVITVPVGSVPALTESMGKDLSEVLVLCPSSTQTDVSQKTIGANAMVGADAVLKFGSVTKTVRVKLGLQGAQSGWNHDRHYHDHCLPCPPIDPIDPIDPPIDPIDPKPIELETIYFQFDESSLNEQSEGRLNQLVKQVNKAKDTVTIKSYADSVGSPAYNVKLSQKRAKAIADYLISKGINPSRIRQMGLGATKAFDTNSGDKNADYTLNRRAQVSVVRGK